MQTIYRKTCYPTLISALLLLLLAGCGGKIETIKVRPLEFQAQAISDTSPAPQNVVPNSPRLARAIELYETGEFTAARDALDQMLWEAPRGWRVYYYLGRAHTECRQYQLAQSRLEHSLGLAPAENVTRSQIYLALAENLEVQGDPARARQYYLTALNLDPQSVAASEALKRLEGLTQLTD